MSDRHSILVVEDNEDCRELFTRWLAGDHDVTGVADGARALETLEPTHEIVLLDRDMPLVDGDTVAHEIAEAPGSYHVVMVSARPFDNPALRAPIDGYLHKPIDRADLLAVVEQYRKRLRYQEALERFFSISAKIGVLESQFSRDELRHAEEYEQLQERLDECRAEVNEAIGPNPEWCFTFRSCGAEADLADVSAGGSPVQ